MTSCLKRYRERPVYYYMMRVEYIMRYINITPLVLFQYDTVIASNQTTENNISLFFTTASFYNIENNSDNLNLSDNLSILPTTILNISENLNILSTTILDISENPLPSDNLNSSSMENSLPGQNLPCYGSFYPAMQTYDSIGTVQLLPRTLYRINRKVRR